MKWDSRRAGRSGNEEASLATVLIALFDCSWTTIKITSNWHKKPPLCVTVHVMEM